MVDNASSKDDVSLDVVTSKIPEPSTPLLTVESISKQYPKAQTPVLRNVSLQVARGEVLVVLGPSGSGKSTLLRVLAGLEPIQDGQVLLDGHAIEKPERNGLVTPRSTDLRTRIGMVFQTYDLFPNRTVLGNLLLAPKVVQHRDEAESKALALQWLERVGLADKADAWPHELSGGQRQRVAICRALMLQPEVLLLDEITAALDPEMVREVLDVVLELASQGYTMVIVTHEMNFARAIADRIVLFDQGGIVEVSDNPQEFFEHPRTERGQQFLKTFTFERSRN